MWAYGGNHAGIGELAVGGESGLGHVKYSVSSKRHAIGYALGEAAEIFGQAGASDQLAVEVTVQSIDLRQLLQGPSKSI